MQTDALLGRTLLGRYRIVRPLGAGAHGRVFLAEDLVRGGERLALKLVEGLVGAGSDDPAQRQLRWFRHPNWAEILDAGRCGEYDWFQATRYVEGRSLATLEGPQPVEWVWRLLEDGARVLRSLHRRGLIHYDVTPGNLLVEGPADAPRFVLTDGGLANVGPVHGFARGTPLYMAPEVTEDRHHDHRADLYSLGLVAYRLATGADPLTGGAGDVLGRRRREPAPHARERRADLPEALDALIAALLAPDPARRVADGNALLAWIARERPGTPDVLPSEAVAAATSGALVGREDVVSRFGRVLDGLVARVPPTGTPTPAAHAEHVLLLEGPPGSGATRLARELAASARVQEIPVLLLAGREGAPDRRNPLRRLVDGLVTLQQAPGMAAPQAALAARGSGSQEREDQAHSDGRTIEKFLAVVEETARRTPFALVVEDFTDLPALSQEAVRVLSRHLLGRAERASGQTPLPVVLVVDLAHEPAESLANPDTVDVRRAVAALPALTLDQISVLCAERFPGLALPQADLESLARASDAQPANVATLLAEAYRRGDLKRDEGAWTWELERIASYGSLRRLPAPQEEALRAAPPSLRRLLDRLALAEAEVPIASARALWSRLGSGDIPSSMLLSVREHGETVHLTLATPGLRRVLLEALTPEARDACASDLLSALDAHPDPRTLIDRVSLRLALHQPSGALLLAHAHRSTLTTDQSQALQPLLRTAATSHPALLADPASRTAIIDLLGRGADAVATAQLVAPHLPRTGAHLPDLLTLATILEDAYQLDSLASLLASCAPITDAPPQFLADLHIRRARCAFHLRRSEQARAPLRAARRALATLGRAKEDHPRLLVEYLKARANECYTGDRYRPATRLLRYARHHARRSSSPALYATTLNNLGVTCRACGALAEAETHLRRALRLRRPLGDISGTIGTQYNLARVYLSQGAPQKAAARLQEAAGLAARHNQVQLLVTCLRELASALDQLDSPAPALDCLGRGIRASERHGLTTVGARLAHEQAPLALLMGNYDACRAALLLSARAARSRSFADARPLHHLALGVTAALSGAVHLAKRALKRAARSRAVLGRDDKLLFALLASVAGLEGDSVVRRDTELRRPRPTQPGRLQFRTGIAVAGALRSSSPASALRLNKLWAAQAQAAPRDRRIALAVVLGFSRAHPNLVAPEIWRTLSDVSTGPADALLHARCLALRCVADRALATSARADMFSRSLRPLVQSQARLPRCLRELPAEHLAAATRLRGEEGAGDGEVSSLAGLHAAAHALLLAHSPSARPDGRRADALRQLIAATSGFEASIDLDTLLQRLTRVMVEITGAQRACIVVLEREPGTQMRIATSISSAGAPVRDQELSHTVIQRVLSARSPLLLHDAFGDEELLGRPSITALSLRSILCVPIQRNGVVMGVLYVDSSAGAGSFDQVDLEVLSLLADQAGAALEANHLVTSLQGAYAELRTMQERLVRNERLRVLGEVSSGVAHEFNNLLTAILARVQLMGLSCPDAEQRGHLSLIEKAALDAAGVVRRLQTFSRHQRTGTFVVVDVAEVCSDAVEFLRPLWSTRRRHGRPPISVRLSCAPGIQVQGNPTELREILTNLIKNSLDALSDRGGQIMVQTAESPGGGVCIRVRDDGPGIAPDHLQKVFTAFFTTKGEGGTGLGLCLSQRLAEQHGGELKLESAPPTGTTATLTLPRHYAGEPTGPTLGVASTCAPRPGPLSVLVVDDDADVLKPLCSYLEQAGYSVTTASDGYEALERLHAAQPNVLLTDIGMPRMDGLELCARALAQCPRLPIVLMSGWASDVDPAKARAAGARALLAKPFAMQQVCELLRQFSPPTARGA